MKKRLVSLLLAFSMMLTFLPVGAVSAFAEEGGTFNDGRLNYTVIDETAKTAKVSGVVNADTLTEADIPDECKGYRITEIGKEAFKGCSSLQSDTIGAKVETIDEYAFKDSASYWNTCKALATVTFAPGSCLKRSAKGLLSAVPHWKPLRSAPMWKRSGKRPSTTIAHWRRSSLHPKAA